jgi:nucleoid-associated protein YgaU
MRNFLKLIILLTAFFVIPGISYSQDDDDEGDIKMSQDEWHLKRDQYAVSAIQLLRRIDRLDSLIDSLKTVNIEADSVILNAENNLYAIVGATREQVIDFRNKFGVLETKVKNSNSTPNSLRSELEDIASSRIICLPEFADRFELLKKKIDGFDAYKNDARQFYDDRYTISEGDCLWKISELKYGNPLLWPVIWNANRNSVLNKESLFESYMKRISNPNLIFPGQEIKIPKLSQEQLKPR